MKNKMAPKWSLDKVGIMEKGVRTRSPCALCKDSAYNSDFFFFLSTLGDNLKHPMLLEPEGQCKEVGKGPVETDV